MSVVSVVVTHNPSKVELGVRFPYNASQGTNGSPNPPFSKGATKNYS